MTSPAPPSLLPLLPVCAFKTSPCMLAPHVHVFIHVGMLPVHTGTILNPHTGFSTFCSVPQHTHTKHTPRPPTTPRPTRTPTHTNTHTTRTQHITGTQQNHGTTLRHTHLQHTRTPQNKSRRWIVLLIVLRRGINLTIQRLNCRFQKIIN